MWYVIVIPLLHWFVLVLALNGGVLLRLFGIELRKPGNQPSSSVLRHVCPNEAVLDPGYRDSVALVSAVIAP